MATTRVCMCGCNSLFPVPPKQPGRLYRHGHKPPALPPLMPGNVMRAKFGGHTEAERRSLDYKLALKSAKDEIESLVQRIDSIDDDIEPLLQRLAALEAEKEQATDRHLTISTTIDILQALIDGKSVRELATPEGVEA